MPRLLADARISTARKNHEPLTDLLTVFYGRGILSANTAFGYSQETRGRYRNSSPAACAF